MAARRTKKSTHQLSLFDAGLDAPVGDLKALATPRLSEQEIISPATEVALFVTPIAREFHKTDHADPGPFEKASYDLYLKLKAETYALSKTTGLLATVLVAVVFLGVVPEIGIGLFRVGSLSRHVLVGLLGWLTILSASYTLVRAAYMVRKKIDSGLFYQHVLQFSGSVAVRIINRFLGVLFVLAFLGVIVLTLIIAREEMVKLVLFLVREFLFLFDPWRPTVTRP